CGAQPTVVAPTTPGQSAADKVTVSVPPRQTRGAANLRVPRPRTRVCRSASHHHSLCGAQPTVVAPTIPGQSAADKAIASALPSPTRFSWRAGEDSCAVRSLLFLGLVV